MGDGASGQALATRLRELRQSWEDLPVTQKHIADALGMSAALVSSYESGGSVPPEDRLKSYARFFATRRSMEGPKPRLVPADDLTDIEERRREELINELVRLREEALHRSPTQVPNVGQLGGRFWFFPDGRPVTILYQPFSRRQLGLDHDRDVAAPPIVEYAKRTHPNYISSLRNADSDAVIELVGHIRAENPRTEVRWIAYDEITSPDQLTGHLVLLGGGDVGLIAGGVQDNPVEWFIRRLDLPVGTQRPSDGDPEFDLEFVVTTDDDGSPRFGGQHHEVYRPRFRRDETLPERPRVLVDGAPQLEYDLGLLVRQRNPLNLSAKITMCSGIFSRGTYGVVRATTDKNFRERNEGYLAEQFADTDDFWMLLQIPVFGAETITPDFERAFLRLRSSR